MSNETSKTVENLVMAIHGVDAPFWYDGTFVPDKPVTVVFKDRTRIEVIREKHGFSQESSLEPLISHLKPAPFGDGKKTRYDRNVRDALQLLAENKQFSIENFDPESAGILKKIQSELLPHDPNPITAELYSINIYKNGGHFAPHKDTPRGPDMFGTLVVCLPPRFYDGELVLTHQGIVKKFHWGRLTNQPIDPNQLQWAAFFGDVDHKIEKTRGGVRVTVTYLLRRGTGTTASMPTRVIPKENLAPRVLEAWRTLLADQSVLPQGGILGYPCCHLYHQDTRFQVKQSPITTQSAHMLKGRDYLTAATALEVGLNVTFHPYMFESNGDESWRLKRFPTPSEQKKLLWQMGPHSFEKRLPVAASSEDDDLDVTWLEPLPSDNSGEKSQTENDSGPPTAAHLHSCEYSSTGYFGNEGSYIDVYIHGTLHIEIPPITDSLRAVKEPPAPPKVKRKRSAPKAKPKQD